MEKFPHFDSEPNESPKDPSVLESITYEGSESEAFDALLHSRETTEARQKSFSEVTDHKLILSSWHVPCHDIILRDPTGASQILHVQPNQLSSSLLSFEQEGQLTAAASRNSSAVAVKSNKSWFGLPDEREITSAGVPLDRIIHVDTYGRWRLIYDPVQDEIWIDNQDAKTLIKYRGFDVNSSDEVEENK